MYPSTAGHTPEETNVKSPAPYIIEDIPSPPPPHHVTDEKHSYVSESEYADVYRDPVYCEDCSLERGNRCFSCGRKLGQRDEHEEEPRAEPPIKVELDEASQRSRSRWWKITLLLCLLFFSLWLVVLHTFPWFIYLWFLLIGAAALHDFHLYAKMLRMENYLENAQSLASMRQAYIDTRFPLARRGLILHAALYTDFCCMIVASWYFSSRAFPWFMYSMFVFGYILTVHALYVYRSRLTMKNRYYVQPVEGPEGQRTATPPTARAVIPLFGLSVHASFYVLFNAMLLLTWMSAHPSGWGHPWFIWPLLVLLMPLVAHYFRTMLVGHPHSNYWHHFTQQVIWNLILFLAWEATPLRHQLFPWFIYPLCLSVLAINYHYFRTFGKSVFLLHANSYLTVNFTWLVTLTALAPYYHDSQILLLSVCVVGIATVVVWGVFLVIHYLKWRKSPEYKPYDEELGLGDIVRSPYSDRAKSPEPGQTEQSARPASSFAIASPPPTNPEATDLNDQPRSSFEHVDLSSPTPTTR